MGALDIDGSEQIDEAKGKIFPCEGCGADLEFHIGKQSMQCPYCGYTKEIVLAEDRAIEEQDFDAMITQLSIWRKERAKAEGGEEDLREVRCDSCGFEVSFVGALTSTDCGACGSPIQQDESVVSDKRVPVDGVMPFKVTRELAQQALRKWVKSRWFAPNQFLKNGARGKFTGMYLPYWTYDSMTFSHYSGQRGEHYWVTQGSGKNKRRVRKTRWYPASGSFQRFFDDVLVPATKGLPEKLLNKLEPWPLSTCQPYNQQVIAGHVAKTYEVELSAGFKRAQDIIDAALLAEVKQRIGGDTQRVHKVETSLDAISYKHLLLPVWLMGYRYGQKTFQVMVNARTGEVQGDRPWSWVKILLAILAAILVVAVGAILFQQTNTTASY